MQQFAGKLVKRSDIVAFVVAEHERLGGLPSTTQTDMQMKKALRDLQSHGLVEKTGGYGIWRFTEAEDDAETQDLETLPDEPDAPEAVGQVIPVQRWFGEGTQLVYVYSYPAYEELARVRGDATWPIKIGRSSRVSLDRILSQIGTGNPEWPVVHLAIKCTDSEALEQTLHRVLKLRGDWREAPGSEWFNSSPELVLELLRGLLEGSTHSLALDLK